MGASENPQAGQGVPRLVQPRLVSQPRASGAEKSSLASGPRSGGETGRGLVLPGLSAGGTCE